jgi:hypothetical protein
MASIASLSSLSTALPAINTHVRGHKHGGQLDSTDAQGGPVQNLFGSLLQTAEKVVGLQSGVVSAAIAAGTAAVSRNGSSISTHSSSTLLQNYLNNLSPKQQPVGVQAPAGSRVNADA